MSPILYYPVAAIAVALIVRAAEELCRLSRRHPRHNASPLHCRYLCEDLVSCQLAPHALCLCGRCKHYTARRENRNRK